METFRFNDSETNDEREGETLADAAQKYLERYDTGDMEEGETFEVRVFNGEDLMGLCAVLTVESAGKGRVASHSIRRA